MNNPHFSVIAPTLNESPHIRLLLSSLRAQSTNNFETIVVDGGSQDDTARIAESLGARTIILAASKEFEARNFGATLAKGAVLVFTCADAALSPTSLEHVWNLLRDNSGVVAITGPDVPYDGTPSLRFIYAGYNLVRLVFSKLPYPLRAFSTSTNFLAVRREAFQRSGGFRTDDINADGLMGRSLASFYGTIFDNSIIVYVSARRAMKFGIFSFVHHYLYVLENFLPGLSGRGWFERLKAESLNKHKKLHIALRPPSRED